MSSPNLDPRLETLLTQETQATNHGDLESVAEGYDAFLAAAPHDVAGLVLRNRFRLRHPEAGAQDRPKILIGGMNDSHFPNFHTVPLLRVADVISLTTGPDEGSPDRISYDYWNERFEDVLGRLPAGFEPDLFFDNQVLDGHRIPIGLEDSPFPTVGGFAHLYRAARNVWAAELFDVLLPLSRPFVEPFARVTGKHVLDLPFGLNWASFHDVIAPCGERDVDVSCTIGPVRTLSGASPARYRLHERMLELERRHAGRFRFVVAHGMPRQEYLDLLRRSRISVNLQSFHGPYNYRTCEIMNSGAMCLHVHDPEQFAVTTDLRDYFEDGKEVVVASWDRLEALLLHYIEHPDEAAAIAAAGRKRLESEYSYEALYRQLFERVAGLEIDRRSRPTRARAYFALGATSWGYEDDRHARQSLLALPGVLEQPLEQRIANLLALLPRLIAWHGNEAVVGLLGREESVSRAFSKGVWEGVELLHGVLPEHPVVSWNRTMLAIEKKRANVTMVRETLALLESDTTPFDPRDLLLITPHVPHLVEPEQGQINFGLLHHRVIASYGDDHAIRRIHLEYMRWHCLRWLLEHEEDAAADRLRECLEMWPVDSVLQRALGERLLQADPAAARRAFERALEVDPGCGEARLALSRLASTMAA